MKLFAIFISICCLAVRGLAQQPAEVWDVYAFGAQGDGKTLDTEAIQSAIDECHEAGGGKVYLHSGQFISGTIILKSNVTLYMEAGAVLRASNDLDHFPTMPSTDPSYTGDRVTNKMLIYAEDASHISILGRGTIDGGRDYWIDGPYGSPSFSIRPRIIHFRGCEDVQVRAVTLYNSASWVQSYQSCRNLLIDGITVDSRENKDIEKTRYADAPGRNTDGLDVVDCNFVRISNCFINSGDDAICLKSFSPDESCSNITITNCIVSSNASGIKIGTETAGTIEDITIQNCVVYDTRVDAVSIMTVDGARISRVNISDITVQNIKESAIFIRLRSRLRTYRKDITSNEPVLKDIIIENIQGTQISAAYGCAVTGLENRPIENVTLRNINLSFEGGGKLKGADKAIEEHEKGYPRGSMFGVLPAYGFYVRHVRNMVMDNIRLSFAEEDHRPAIFCDDVSYLELSGVRAAGSLQSPGLVRLVNSTDAVISSSYSTTPIAVFAEILGKQSKDIVFLNNKLPTDGEVYKTSKGAEESNIQVLNNF